MRVAVSYDGRRYGVPDTNTRKLIIRGDYTKDDWKDLEKEMLSLGVERCEDPFLKTQGINMVSLEYVRNKIAQYN